jgi:3-hydroxyisobutyrate dehydrogenase
MPEIAEVCMVGLGRMGAGLAALLTRAGFEVTGVDPAGDGAELRRLAQLDRRTDAVCVSVPGPGELVDVVDELLRFDRTQRPRYLVNFTTVGPECAVMLDERLAREAPELLYAECPLTGGVPRLRNHECCTLFGSRAGEPDPELQRLLDAVARRVFVLADVGAAATAKLVNNVAAVSAGLATLEALRIGVRAGLEAGQLFEVLEAGTGDSYILRNSLTRAVLKKDLETGFSTRLALKDMRLAKGLAAGEEVEAPYVELAAAELERQLRRSLGDCSFAAGAALELEDGHE